MSINALIVISAPVAVAIAKAVVELLKSWMKKHGSTIEIRVGDRVISTINSGGDQSKISKLIKDELDKDAQQQSANKLSTT
jgi:hypothetical protein